jgi:hypothetical protein
MRRRLRVSKDEPPTQQRRIGLATGMDDGASPTMGSERADRREEKPH